MTSSSIPASTPAGLSTGKPWPLGATPRDGGVNFALFSAHASAVWLCLLDDKGVETARLALPAHTHDIWHGFLPDAGPGLRYGFRVAGPHTPGEGHRFNVNKLLIDPYARGFANRFIWTDAHLDNAEDNAAYTLHSRVVDAAFDWTGDRAPDTDLADTVLYEVHVKGFTQTHPDVPPEQRGRYAGVASDAAIAHLRRIGATAVSLLPVHQCLDERPLIERGQTNYWGYNTIGFFAPDARFAHTDPIAEFRQMVRRLHAAGIEVILDVVYNHTAEGDHRGPVLSFRGIDNASYYHLRANSPGFYEHLTGTGNALDASQPRVMQMILDSLRYWAGEMHVDGFRFDLATTLGRGPATSGCAFDVNAPIFQAIAQDPLLARVKLIAEPWDVGFSGYRLGGFPAGWSEWNDRYRDGVRAFWVRKAAYRGELAARLCGSADTFGHGGRAPVASINYVAAHDGFTLHDVVSYDRKHNEANGEENRDGHEGNNSWNCGVEGPTDLLAVNALRARLKRAILATLFISHGVPMLCGGDELGRTQNGNNNAYNQDNELSWFDWSAPDEELIAFVAKLAALRQRYPLLRQNRWLSGSPGPAGARDILWLNRQGVEMLEKQWDEWGRYAFGYILGAGGTGGRDLLVLMNAEASDWTMPLPEGCWCARLDTGQRNGEPEHGSDAVSGQWLLKARSLSLFERCE